MSVLPTPRVNPPRPAPNPTAAAEARAIVAETRERHEAQAPERAAVIAAGPALEDPAAAAGCRCACHPRPADVSLHGGGPQCPCQLSDAERTERRAEALAALSNSPLHAEIDAALEAQRAEFTAVVARLEVDASIEVSACPIAVAGSADGTAFYARERHGSYQVVVDPSNKIESLHTSSPGAVLVAAGDEYEFEAPMTPALLLEVAVGAARTYLRRVACTHGRSPHGSRWCCDCGVALDSGDS